jgi:AraC-like DNA-binding protein
VRKSPRYYTLRGRLKEYSSPELHRHGEHQLLTVRRGISLLVDAEGRKPLYGAMCALIPAGCPHRSVVVGEGIEYQSLYLEPAAIEISAAIAIFPLGDLARLLFDRLAERRPSDEEKGLGAEALSLLLKLVEEERSLKATGPCLPEPRLPENRRVAAYLEEHCAESLRLASVAGAVGVSPRQLERRFVSETGLGPFAYLRLYRMLMASVSLGNSSRKVEVVAEDCGYGSLSSFYSDFRSTFGTSPAAFRLSSQPSAFAAEAHAGQSPSA